MNLGNQRHVYQVCVRGRKELCEMSKVFEREREELPYSANLSHVVQVGRKGRDGAYL